MKILFLTNVFPPTTGGSAADYNIITDELIKKNEIKKISVISLYINSEKLIKASKNNVKLYRVLIDYKKRRNIFIKSICFIIQTIQCFIIGLFIRLVKSYDLIQTHSDMLWVNNRLFIHPGISFLSKSSKKKILDIRDKFSIPNNNLYYSHYLVNSEACYSLLCKVIAPKNISLIYCPFDIFSKESLNNKNLYLQKKPYIAFIGNISLNKGIHELLDAMKILNKNKLNSIKLLFCGEYNDHIIDIPNNCEYLGSLENIDAMKLLFGADLLILPSKSESHPRVIVESIIYKTPFLMTRGVIELEKYFPKNMLENIDPNYIANRIDETLKNDSDYLSNNYPIHLHKIDNVINYLFKVYKNLE